MRIAYIAIWGTSRETGVLKKIAGQARAWQSLGQEVKVFLLSPQADIWQGLSHTPTEVVVSINRATFIPRLAALCKQVVDWKPDTVYYRFWKYYPPIEFVMNTIPTIVEMNTDDVTEASLMMSRLHFTYHMLTRGRVLRRAKGLVCVTKEIASKLSRWETPKAVIGNGIDLARCPSYPSPDNPNPRLLFIGSPGLPWHGVDKITSMAARFPSWTFDLVGPAKADIDKNLALPNLHAHGAMGSKEYSLIVQSADAALGSLALHRLGMGEASTLKVREYLCNGIPTVVGYQDTDFPRKTSFLLELPNTQENVISNEQTIEQFVTMWKGRRVPREQLAHLDIMVKERERISFAEKVLNSRG
jgi:hypothetical protein